MNITYRKNRLLTTTARLGQVLVLLVAVLGVLPSRLSATATGAVPAFQENLASLAAPVPSARARGEGSGALRGNSAEPSPRGRGSERIYFPISQERVGADEPNTEAAPPGRFFPPPMIHQPPPGPQLVLHRGTFDIRTAQQFAPTSSLAATAPGPYAIIQLHGPITLADRQALEQTGIELLEYLPDYAYLVRGTAAQREAATRLPQVYAHTSFTLADKLAPALLRAVARGDSGTWPVRIVGWRGDESTLARELEALGLGRQVAADASLLLQVAGLESVRWIEPVGRPRIVNDYARNIMNVEPVWQNHQLFGAGQIIAVTDSGLDTGDLNTISPDFAGRITATHVLSAGGHWDDNHGHGTHVAGSAAGAGVQSGANPAQHDYISSFAGIAPEATLVIQAFEANPVDGSITGLPEDLYSLFAQVYTDGARLHTNSWGDYTGPISDTEAAYGGYPYGSQRTDEFVWNHPDMTIFFGAGNSGVDGVPGPLGLCIGDGVIDPDSLLAPGTAKNVITVGATESDRSTGGLGGLPWLLLNLCFATPPIAIDPLANNANGMAAFSSRGPADDGRAKPDIVAPGTNIVSNRSHVPGATTLWGTHETYPDHYAYSGGTSMATPLVAGMGALVREWLVSQGHVNPSAAAVKAVLLNTTKDIAPGQYGELDAQEIPFDRPNSVAGWGRADIGFIDAPTPYALWLDDHTAGLNTGDVITYTHTFTHPLRVVTNTQALRVMLTWTDPPASLSAVPQLVNDLDLQVVGPGGTMYYGNVITGGDRINNVEGVVVLDPPLGQYEVAVQAFNVPTASQPYALAVAGPLNIIPPPAPTVWACAATSLDTLSAHWTVSDPGNITLYRYAIGTTPGGTDVITWTETTESSFLRTDLSLSAGQAYYVVVKARNAEGLWSAGGVSNGVVAGSGPCPGANFSADPVSGPAPLGVQFTDTSTGTVDTWLWDLDGVTSTVQHPLHTYTVAGVYTVSLRVSGPGGSDQLVKPNYITVTEAVSQPVADFVAAPLTGHPPLTVVFTDTSTGTIDTWLWDFGDEMSSTLQNPSHMYDAVGVYTVTLTVGGPGGSDTLTLPNYITVYEPVKASFVASPTLGAPPLAVQFTDSSSGPVATWDWTFGDGGSSDLQHPTYTYEMTGVYTVGLTVRAAGGSATWPGGTDTLTRIGYITVQEQHDIYLPLILRNH